MSYLYDQVVLLGDRPSIALAFLALSEWLVILDHSMSGKYEDCIEALTSAV